MEGSTVVVDTLEAFAELEAFAVVVADFLLEVGAHSVDETDEVLDLLALENAFDDAAVVELIESSVVMTEADVAD